MTKPAQQTARKALISRLSMYWKMEGGNIVFMPGVMIFLAGGQVGAPSLLAIVPMMALLAIGTVYWRAKLLWIEHGIPCDDTVRRIAALDRPLAFGTVIAVLAALGAWTVDGVAVGTADKWVSAVAATMAALEYVNYYHRQLQHFDHLPDWKRLLAGGGFRKSQLRQDIDRLAVTARSNPDRTPR